MQWNWTAGKTAQWLQPAIEAPYLALRWRQRGFERFLDNGCGPGRHTVFFASRGFRVTALDQSEQALEYLRAWAEKDGMTVEAVRGDLLRLPFAAEQFDCIMDYNASYHTDTDGYHKAIAQLRRVLRPGGEVYLTLLSQNDPGFLAAPDTCHVDRYTLTHEGGTPHFYGRQEDFPELFQGFSMAMPPREICTCGPGSTKESIHYHLLLKKDEL